MASKSRLRSVMVNGLCLMFCSLICSSVAKHGPDKSVCDSNSITNSPTPKRPKLSEKYRLTVECNLKDKNLTTDITEYFDYQNQRAAVHQWELGFHGYGIYSYPTNELYTVETQMNTCTVDSLATSDSTFLFGFKTSSSNPKVKQMFSAYGALRFGNGTAEQYMGQTTIRGMKVDHWKSCQYWPSKDATMNVDWYFTIATWSMADGRSQVPVRCTVAGNIYDNPKLPNTPRAFQHTYEFSEYLTDDMAQLDSKYFETPAGVVCPGRKDTRKLTTPKSEFQFTAEILTGQTISFIKEFYDQQLKLFRYDTVPSAALTSNFGYGLQTQVHDFNEGITYFINPASGNCTATPIDGTGFDAKFTDPSNTLVRMRTPSEFFYFDKTQYAYEGVKSVRGVPCNVYITQRSDWPPLSQGINSTWEWYFAQDDWVQSTGHKYNLGMPMMLLLNSAAYGKYIYNIYQYDEEQPPIWDFDTSKCYNYTEKKDYMFKLPGNYQQTAAKNLQQFKKMVLIAIHNATGLSPVRITNMQVDYDASNILVSLTLLGTSLIKGDVSSPVKQIPLMTAVRSLNSAINSGSLIVPVVSSSGPIQLVASPYTLQSTTVRLQYYKQGPKKTTFTTGAVVGLAIGMAVLFFVLGFGAVYMFYKRNGGSFAQSDKQMDNPAYENAT